VSLAHRIPVRHALVTLALLAAACTFTGLGNYTLLCVPGAAGCDGSHPATCNPAGTAFVDTGNDCAAPAGACFAGSCVLCSPGATECADEAHVKTCGSNGQSWSAPASCGDQTCVSGADGGATGSCQGVCAPKATRCTDDAHVETCDPTGNWGSPTVCGSQACVNGGCTGVCAPGALGCQDQQPATCNSFGQWANTGAACSTATTCVSGLCTGECGPTQTKCADDLKVITCSPTGAWNAPAACASQACVGGACTGVCAPGTTQCSGNGVQTCSSVGQWGAVVGCGASARACCAGACTSVQSDPKNCGACGVICPSGDCYREFCDGFLVSQSGVTQAPPPTPAIAVDATSLYWTTGVGGAVMKASLSYVAGGSVTTLASSQAAPANSLAVDASSVYWINSGGYPANRTLMKVPLEGGSPSTVASAPEIGFMVLDAADVYWTSSTLMQTPIAGGASTTVASGGAPANGLHSLAIDSANLYAIVGGSSALVQLPLGGGVPVTLSASASYVAGSDGTSVAWFSGSGAALQLLQTPVGGGSTVTLATTASQPLDMVVNGSTVYWVEGLAPTMLKKVPIGGGATTTVVSSSAWIYRIAVDATSVYLFGANITMIPR